ncbi:calcium:proton antiporter [Colwellia sp. MT41]|uniref:Sodium:calcium antiporter n=1 Tax=Colwellia marinimaniae TaxID=1513592 RepID=A0ABQ0MQ32_9GAMM|nr:MULTISPECIES: calcium/sodium antiporter [Colwellia]ALO36038.1 calcium:proton antiporter [Colwellia sp. MT41]GAW94448.1 sodium:calcium antiporter [Colwellia marinimaniae]
MLEHIFILLIALVALVWSADKFVFGASSLARNLGISPMIIGLTIVAMGSSAPEMMVATTASLQGNINTAIGNAIGSNITNIALVLGITALLKPLTVSSQTIKREIPLVLAITALGYWLLIDNHFSFYEGIILITGFAIYIIALLVITLKKTQGKPSDDPLIIEAEHDVAPAVSMKLTLLWLGVGIIVLPLSASFLVDSSVFIAKAYGISDLVIGLTIIAIGTSLPELAACIMSIIKKEDDLALGNIIGSNIFNILAVLPIAALIAPGDIDSLAASRDAPYMLGVTLLLFFLCFSRRMGAFRITRAKGVLLLLSFIAYQVLLFGQLSS